MSREARLPWIRRHVTRLTAKAVDRRFRRALISESTPFPQVAQEFAFALSSRIGHGAHGSQNLSWTQGIFPGRAVFQDLLLKWLPWKYIVRRVARHHGFLDPISVMSRLANFAQPSEVGEPIELLRAGLVFHARGLMNTRAIQNNLDWVWPYWVERQFNPHDVSFIPRAFSISHVNLSHRNWTAVGLPDNPYLPIVDPSGLLTPFYDGWSLDAWLIRPGGDLLPSKSKALSQSLDLAPDTLAVETEIGGREKGLRTRVDVLAEGPGGTCRLRIRAQSDRESWLAVSLRPYNPEGVSFIHEIRLDAGRKRWTVNGDDAVVFSAPAERHFSSEYHLGDVYHKLLRPDQKEDSGSRCKVGLATGAALFAVPAGGFREITVGVDLAKDRETRAQFPDFRRDHAVTWPSVQAGLPVLSVPDERFTFLHRAAVRSLLLHSPDDVFPGPYTYKRFWFRDAAFVLNSMLSMGMADRVERTLDRFPLRQTLGGYYLSQEGEWDSNGEALWILARYCRVTGRKPKAAWMKSIARGADWIGRKRRKGRRPASAAGLFPAGFSAEHLGPNDYYYWDDFWGVAGLESAAELHALAGDGAAAARCRDEALRFRAAIDASLTEARKLRGTGAAMPASPLRRMDAGAVGNLAVSFPLALWPERDPRLLATTEFLLGKCLYKGGFFQDMIHSGINAYLTIHLAQALLRAGDARFFQLLRDTAALASPTGQWPEAIHPHTLGGCMGDGQHVWAAAEWAHMMRNLFVREEGGVLILASGIPEEWLQSGRTMSFGPAPTSFGPVTVTVSPRDGDILVAWEGKWHSPPTAIEVRLPGRAAVTLAPSDAGESEIPWLAPPQPVRL
jgi:hypothetical protein